MSAIRSAFFAKNDIDINKDIVGKVTTIRTDRAVAKAVLPETFRGKDDVTCNIWIGVKDNSTVIVAKGFYSVDEINARGTGVISN